MHDLQPAPEENTLAPSVGVQPRVRPPVVEVECEHLASVKGPDETFHYVIRKPTNETMARIREWADSGESRRVQVSDCSGLHISNLSTRVVEHGIDYDTCVVTTAA